MLFRSVSQSRYADAIEWEERQRDIEISDEQKSKIAELYWEQWGGYHETGYIGEAEFQPIVDAVLSGEYQRHQETKLW